MESYPITEDESLLDVCCFKEDEDEDETPEAELVQCTGRGCKFNDFKCCVSSMGLSIIRCLYFFCKFGHDSHKAMAARQVAQEGAMTLALRML